MERAQKFGTFSGVFTPALLTIISVIMYLRLGWIVGQVGLIYTIAIILVANIISFTTGLSLSSIATDKKVRAGGVYYMLSRSLGLPIGGALGATIYLAFTLAIALNITGFAESFLSVPQMSQLVNLEPSKDAYRIVGIVTLLVVSGIAYISTSLAIKTQFIVLAAIGLSLLSILGGMLSGYGGNHGEIILMPAENAAPLATIFAVFFPAATGFMAGASMSGDLINPKRSIPKGTMLAIITGMLLNMVLAIGFAVFVNRELLLGDSSFIKSISLSPILVIAGIWGATLSTALGGILGGPRVIQAMAKDNLAPHFLARGRGINNEPYLALVVTFFISLSAVLIGDLNTIARLATMFFITAYAFINLAFSLESWASTDFRPSFRIPRWVGWTGFTASFIVMMQIDFMAMLIAFFLIWATWFVMKRKQQKLEPGDVWQSVWANVVRHSVHNVYVKGLEDRNWKPNIMLFSGNPETKQQLIELGKALIANHGLLTIINLQQYKEGEKTKPRFQQKQLSEESVSSPGVFNRVYYCNNIYQGIENLTETYGFAGVEPNTILMGWTRNLTDGVRFVKMVKHIIDLDLNLLLMDYDTRRGFGERTSIDIWWQGSGNNGNLALNLVKFLWLSEGWKDSRLRLMIENEVNDEYDTIYSFAREVIDNLRIDAEIVIINNEIENKPFYDLIRIESGHTDITFLSIPEIEEGKEFEFLEKMYKLSADLGSVVLIKASTQFKKLNIGTSGKGASLRTPLPLPAQTVTPLPDEAYPENPQLQAPLREFSRTAHSLTNEMATKGFGKIFSEYAEVIINANTRVESTYNIISRRLTENNHYRGEAETLKAFFKLINNTYTRYEQILTYLHDSFLIQQQKNLEVLFESIDSRYNNILNQVPQFIEIFTTGDDEAFHAVNHYIKLKAGLQKLGQPGTPMKTKIAWRKIITLYYPQAWHSVKRKLWQKFHNLCAQYHLEQKRAFHRFRDSVISLENALINQALTPQMIASQREDIQQVFTSFLSFINDARQQLAQVAHDENMHYLSLLNQALYPSEIPKKKISVLRKHEIQQMKEYPLEWRLTQQLIINQNLLDSILSGIDYKLWHHIKRTQEEIGNSLWNKQNPTPLMLPSSIIAFIDNNIQEYKKGKTLSQPSFNAGPDLELQARLREIEETINQRIIILLSRIPSHINIPRNPSETDATSKPRSGNYTRTIEVSKLVHFIVQNNLQVQLSLILKEYSLQLRQTEKEIIEITRLLKFTLSEHKDESLQGSHESFLEEQKKRTMRVLEKINLLRSETYDKLNSALNNTSRLLNLPAFIKTAENLRLLEKSYESSHSSPSRVKRTMETIKGMVRRNFINVWYDRSRHIIELRQARLNSGDKSFPISQVHSLNEQVSVNNEVMAAIPPYYQQLFLRKNNYFMDFWHGRQKQLDEAIIAISRHDQGYNGALMVKGENSSGKSFFVNYVVHKHLTNRTVYIIAPPFAGSASEAEFVRSFQRATDNSDSIRKTLTDMPGKSVIVIEDLELWWEKTTTGFKVIKLITTLIEEFGNKIFFILTVNSHAFKSINRFVPIDLYLLGVIECTPFSAEELRRIIIQRHRSGSMKLVFNHKDESELHSWDYARLFNSYFNFTRGNVGLSLLTWLANVEKAEGNLLYIRSPRKPDTSVINRLDSETLIFLVQFILHKRLNYEKIQRIMLMSPHEVKEKVQLLKRSAIITEPQQGVFILNPNLHAFIRERFIEKELL